MTLGSNSNRIRWGRSMVLMAVIGLLAVTVCVATGPQKDQIDHPACPYCGMDRHKFAHSRALIIYDDGTNVGTCSLHCAAIDLSLNIDKTPRNIMVADYNTRQLIDAENAHWVLGGDKMGVMTKRAKWAFASGEDARAFVTAHGGTAGVFPGVLRAAYEDMYEDLRMIRAKRQMMRNKKES